MHQTGAIRVQRERWGAAEEHRVQRPRGEKPRLEVPTKERGTRAEAVDTRTGCSGWRQRDKYR